MGRILTNFLAAVLASATLGACHATTSKPDARSDAGEKAAVIGNFDADSAYNHISRQVAFGPRVPGTEGHRRCSEYLIGELRRFGADTVIVQEAELTAFNGDRLPIRNIFARFNPAASNKILLAAHWDTRPWADNESKEEDRAKPIPGANDGGSGVAVILEIARNLGIKAPSCGVDILFADAEDYGNGNGFSNSDKSWCLGTQYWVEHMPYNTVNKPSYGILLDMVGGVGAKFHREHFSNNEARQATLRVWGEAQSLGLNDIFINKVGGAVVDDHVFLTEAGIPTTDIIENMSDATGNFPTTWHTLDDDMQYISRRTLDAVGKTVLNVVYKEKDL